MKAVLALAVLGLLLTPAAVWADEDEPEEVDDVEEEEEEVGPFENTPEWEDDSGNVIFMDDAHFESWKEENPKFLAFFYAPWCGHCKAAKPFYGAASKKVSLPMVAMDCTGTGKATCDANDVSGFPTIKYFDGDDVTKYDGARTEAGFSKYMQKKDPNYEPGEFVNEVPVEWENNGRVIHMTDEHWDQYQGKTKQFITFFYAPWCGHCKATKPDFAEASSKFRRSMPFLAVDCTANSETCQKFNVTSYPQLKFFKQGQEESHPNGEEMTGRQSGDFITFVEKKLDEMTKGADGEVDISKLRVKQLRKMLRERGVKCLGCTEKSHFVDRVKETMHMKKKEAKKGGLSLMQERRLKSQKEEVEKGWGGEFGDETALVHLADYNFEEYVKEHTEGFLVMFYAPWCGHCKEAKPWAVKAAANVAKWGAKQTMVVVNAEANPELSGKYKIKGFPDYKYFENGELHMEYYDESGKPRGNVGWEKMLMKKHDPEWSGDPDAGPFENEPKWDDDSGDVVFMDDSHFSTYRDENQRFLAFFFAPWCGHCKAAKPHYGKASSSEDVKVPMLAMDCTGDGASTCGDFGVSSYPTIKWFDGPGEPEDYSGARTEEGFVEFISENQDGKKEVGPFENKPQWKDDSHDVVFMDDAHFESWQEENPKFLAFFYAPWCGHCKAAKPHYGEASLEVETPLVAMDCTGKGKKTCDANDVKGFPTIKFFDGDDVAEFDGARTKDGFVSYVEEREGAVEEIEISKDEL